jgi:hypothetical protein
VELLLEVVPGLSNGVVLQNSANPANSLAWRETESAGKKLGVKLTSQEVRSPKDFRDAFAEMAEQRPEVLLVIQDALTLEYRKEKRTPTMLRQARGRMRVISWSAPFTVERAVGIKQSMTGLTWINPRRGRCFVNCPSWRAPPRQ